MAMLLPRRFAEVEERRGMLLVDIEKPGSEPLSAWFSELRDWLDANRCTPSVFKLCGRRIDRLIYRISFDHAAQAHRFCQCFARYLPTIRRATPFERDQLRAMVAAEKAGTADQPSFADTTTPQPAVG